MGEVRSRLDGSSGNISWYSVSESLYDSVDFGVKGIELNKLLRNYLSDSFFIIAKRALEAFLPILILLCAIEVLYLLLARVCLLECTRPELE